jgi:nucleoside-diphosphate-sugar epimerase
MAISSNLEELSGKNVLLTGGCGFIGSEITKQLSTIGANTTIIDNLSSGKEEYVKHFSNVKIIQGDLQDPQIVTDVVKKQQYIVHLAALPFIPDSYHIPMEFFNVNVNATINLALCVIKENSAKRFVHISSSEIYGSAQEIPMNENHPTIPHSTYAVSKLAGERVIYTMQKEHNFPAVIIRPFNSFGPNITQPYIIPEVINQIMSGNKQINLGNIESKRDFTFVSDTARGILNALVTEDIDGETINVGSNRETSIENLVIMISKLLGKDIEIEIDSSRLRPFDVNNLVCDYTKAKELLGWNPEISLEDGLQSTIDWVKQNGINIKKPFRNWGST